jgi:hypothetical protein
MVAEALCPCLIVSAEGLAVTEKSGGPVTVSVNTAEVEALKLVLPW